MRKQVWCWQCELCGNTWIASGVESPAQCSKCKKRGWHTRATANQQEASIHRFQAIERGWAIDDPVIINRPDGSATYCVQSEVHPSDAKYAEMSYLQRPNMDALRSICAGSIPRVEVEQEEIEDCTPECCECGHKLTGKAIKGRGVVWGCTDSGCAMHGREQKVDK